jgi:hypothetical protein
MVIVLTMSYGVMVTVLISWHDEMVKVLTSSHGVMI